MNNELLNKINRFGFCGLSAHWNEINGTIDIETLVQWEETERQVRGLKRRFKSAKIDAFKPLSDFDWNWPKKCDRGHVEDLFKFDFIDESANVILSGPNGVGKSTIACNLAHQAVLNGYNVLFVTASNLLNDLISQDGDQALSRRLKYYASPTLLCVDEIGYLSYSNRHADLLFEIISKRYKKKSTIITTNKAFAEWDQIFPNAACVVSLIDRLIHKSEMVFIEGESYRLKEAKERNAARDGLSFNKKKGKIKVTQSSTQEPTKQKSIMTKKGKSNDYKF
jgi:DNA replication protein DnaC